MKGQILQPTNGNCPVINAFNLVILVVINVIFFLCRGSIALDDPLLFQFKAQYLFEVFLVNF